MYVTAGLFVCLFFIARAMTSSKWSARQHRQHHRWPRYLATDFGREGPDRVPHDFGREGPDRVPHDFGRECLFVVVNYRPFGSESDMLGSSELARECESKYAAESPSLKGCVCKRRRRRRGEGRRRREERSAFVYSEGFFINLKKQYKIELKRDNKSRHTTRHV